MGIEAPGNRNNLEFKRRIEMEKMQIGNWTLRVGERKIIGEPQISYLEECIERWSDIETEIHRRKDAIYSAAVKRLDIPTILCRIDMAPLSGTEKKIEEKIYEIESQPAGMGITTKLGSLDFIVKEMWSSLGQIGINVPSSQRSLKEEDRIFAHAMGWKWIESINDISSLPSLLWIRGRGEELSSEILQRALSPVTSHPDKTYLLDMGLAETIEDVDNLPWKEGFVVKPLYGTECHNVLLWEPEEKKRETSGIHTRTKIQKILNGKEERFVVQPFIFPQEEERKGKEGWIIWRIFFAYDPSGQWRFIGGFWNWRPCLKIHGASDAKVGGLISKSKAV